MPSAAAVVAEAGRAWRAMPGSCSNIRGQSRLGNPTEGVQRALGFSTSFLVGDFGGLQLTLDITVGRMQLTFSCAAAAEASFSLLRALSWRRRVGARWRWQP
jgi:hypothetical protein